MNSETHDESQSSLFSFSSPASDDVKLTREDRLLAIVASRPRYLDRLPIGTEHVRWAISELEREGIHPVLKLIIRAIGRGSQRDVVQLVDEFYRVAATKPPRHHIDEHGSRLEALYDVVLADARESVRVEFTADRVAMEEAWSEVDAKQASAEATLKEATEALQLAEATSVFAREELDKDRLEHAAIQQKLLLVVAELAASERSLSVAQRRIEVLVDQRDAALALKRERDSQVQSCHAQLSQVRDREVKARRKMGQRVDKARLLQLRVRRHEKALDQERLLTALQSNQLKELTQEHTRLAERLAVSQSRLTKSRQLAANLHDKIGRMQAAVGFTSERLRAEELARASAERERALAIQERDLARTEVERTRQLTDDVFRRLSNLEIVNQAATLNPQRD